jgi:hypothetical protein
MNRSIAKSTFIFVLGDITKTLVCEVVGAAINSAAPVYTQAKAIHQAQCLLTGHASMITEIPPEKFNMGNSLEKNTSTKRTTTLFDFH